MQRITITANDDFLEALDAHMRRTGATNRSEALRDLARRGLRSAEASRTLAGDCVGVISFAYDRRLRDLDRKVAEARDQRHDRVMATVAVPLDHGVAVEVQIMAGNPADVATHAEALFLQRGVLHGNLALVPVETVRSTHAHGGGEAHEHVHLKLRETF